MHADNDIIRIPRVSQSPAFKFFIELVQIDVCEQGAQVPALCGVLHYAELTGLYPCYLPPLVLIIST